MRINTFTTFSCVIKKKRSHNIYSMPGMTSDWINNGKKFAHK